MILRWAMAKVHLVVAIQLTPGLKECYHENLGLSIMKVVVGLILQVLCSYITFPLYALVTQVK
jgi:mlo protein